VPRGKVVAKVLRSVISNNHPFDAQETIFSIAKLVQWSRCIWVMWILLEEMQMKEFLNLRRWWI